MRFRRCEMDVFGMNKLLVRCLLYTSFRLYEMFMGAFDQAIPWSTNGARGCRRFLDRVWRLQDMILPGEGYSKALTPLMHETIKKVGEDYEAMKDRKSVV